MSWSMVVKALVLLLILAAAIYVVRFAESHHSFKAKQLLQTIQDTAPYDELVYVLICLVGIPLFLPDTAMNLVGALLFGPLLGTALAWIGVFFGAIVAFYLAKFLGRDLVQKLFGKHLETVDQYFRNSGFQTLLLIRLLPIMPFGAVSLAAGLTSIRTRDYLLATGIGILPVTFIHQFLFSRIGKTMLEENFVWSDLMKPPVLIPCAVYAVLLVVAYVVATRLAKPVSS